MAASPAPPRIDIPTVLAMSALAYTLSNPAHEGLGHGGMCMLVGGHPTVLNAIFFEYDEKAASVLQQKWISAGGSMADVIVGLPALGLARRPGIAPSWRYFLWLFAAVNLLTAFGYLLYSGIAGIGDWAHVVEGLGSPLLLRGGMAVIGALLYFIVAPRLLLPAIDPFLGADPAGRGPRSRRVCLLPYIAGSLSLVVAGILNPYGMQVVLISAVAAGFGGTSLLAWYFDLPRRPLPDVPAPLPIERSWPWIVAGIVELAVFVVVLGPGVRLG